MPDALRWMANVPDELLAALTKSLSHISSSAVSAPPRAKYPISAIAFAIVDVVHDASAAS
jgi:hypothetical protein